MKDGKGFISLLVLIAAVCTSNKIGIRKEGIPPANPEADPPSGEHDAIVLLKSRGRSCGNTYRNIEPKEYGGHQSKYLCRVIF